MHQNFKRAAAAWIGAVFLAAGSAAAGATTVILSDDGGAELRVPATWGARPDIGRSATLRVADARADAYLIATRYPTDKAAPARFETFAHELSAGLMENLEDATISKPRQLTINGRRAIEYAVFGRIGDDRFAYLSTVVDGRQGRHHLLGWTLAERYAANRAALRAVAASFRESATRRAPRERIELDFAWPRQGEATFEAQLTQTKRGETRETRVVGVTRMRALDDVQLRVSTEITDHHMTSSDADAARSGFVQKLLARIANRIPAYIVGAEGTFIGVDDLDGFYGELERGIADGLPGATDAVREQVRVLVRRLLPAAALAQSIEEEWNSQVANWAGGAYVPGETYTLPAEYRAAALGDAVFPMTITQRVLGRVGCNPADAALRCVQLEQTSRVADPAFTRAMHALVLATLRNLAGEKADAVQVSVDRAEFVRTVTVISEPKTLLPHEVRTSKVTTVVVTESGRSETREDVETSVTRYRH